MNHIAVHLLLLSIGLSSSISARQLQDDGNEDICQKMDYRQVPEQKCLRAAVLEFNRHELSDCKASAKVNLNRLERATQLAAKNGAHMIVYPEGALHHSNSLDYILACLEDIPDPQELSDTARNPCIQVDCFKSNYILRRLSCIARSNQVYLVANYGTSERCDATGNPDCPDNNITAFNTDVVFDPEGNYIKRYRKWNLFNEVYSKPATVEHTYFDTPFGRFGVFTCFDIVYKRPSVDLVENYNIDAAVFPTLWYDQLPLWTAIQVQDAWSWRNKVPLLASNLLRPQTGTTGSGIYSGLDTVYVGPNNKKSRLILANLQPKSHRQNHSDCEGGFEPQIIDLNERPVEKGYRSISFDMMASDATRTLDKQSDKFTLCSGEVCCSLDYQLDGQTPDDLTSKVVLIVRDVRRRGLFEWYEQFCTLATIKKATQGQDGEPSIIFDTNTLVAFRKLSLSAAFTTQYVYPIAAQNASILLDRSKKQFNCVDDVDQSGQNNCSLNLLADQNEPIRLYTFGLYGRLYDRDR